MGCESSVKEEVAGTGSGLAGVHLKNTCTAEMLTTSRKWLTLEGAVRPGSARPQMSKHQMQKRHGSHKARPLSHGIPERKESYSNYGPFT